MMRITLNEDTVELLGWLAKATSLDISGLIDRLIAPQLPALWELRTLLEAYTDGSNAHEEAANLLTSFGPEPLSNGVRRVAPAGHKTLEDRFLASFDEPAQAVRPT